MEKVTKDRILPLVCWAKSFFSVPIKRNFTFPIALRDTVRIE